MFCVHAGAKKGIVFYYH